MSHRQDPPQPPKAQLNEGLLDDAGLDALIHDITNLTQLHTVRVKGRATGHSIAAGLGRDATGGLQDALAALRAGARGVQLHYHYDGEDWCDTLIPAPGGWRVVRMRQQPPPQ